MTYEARVLTVLIASPGDARDARDVVEATIASWNRDRARTERVVLQPLRWETDAVPQIGPDGQQVINRQLVDEADVVVAVFRSRLGAPTDRAASGTAEEIERAHDRGVPVHVYFSEQPHPHGVDPDELKRLNAFKKELQGRGLVGGFASHDDLVAKVRTALESDVVRLAGQPRDGTAEADVNAPRAVLRARYDYDREPHYDSRGRMTMRNRRERLVIENLGSGVANNVRVEVEAVGQGEAPRLRLEGPIANILPRSAVNVPALVHVGVAMQWKVTFHWNENGSEFTESQAVTSV